MNNSEFKIINELIEEINIKLEQLEKSVEYLSFSNNSQFNIIFENNKIKILEKEVS